MKNIQSILVVVPSQLVSEKTRHFVRNAMGIGEWLRCEVHFLSSDTMATSLQSAVADYKHERPSAPSTMIIHSEKKGPLEKKLLEQLTDVIGKYSCDFLVLEDGSLLSGNGGAERQRILEASPIPVLLLPKEFDFTKKTPRSFLVPLSGEARTNAALIAAMGLAHQTHSAVDFLHVTSPENPCTCDQTFESLGDQPHHEYREMMDKIASEANPYSTPEERSHIRRFHHCTGFTTDEILGVLQTTKDAILVLEWKGTLAVGRARTIKELLQKIHTPILFVRAVVEQKSRLRVGKNIRAA